MRSRHLLMGRLYETEELQQLENGFTAMIRLNREDAVFRGHFPGHPILPGACTVQIIKELLSEALGKELRLHQASNIKFLAFVDPVANEHIWMDIQYALSDLTRLSCSAKVYAGPVTFCSFRGEFRL